MLLFALITACDVLAILVFSLEKFLHWYSGGFRYGKLRPETEPDKGIPLKDRRPYVRADSSRDDDRPVRRRTPSEDRTRHTSSSEDNRERSMDRGPRLDELPFEGARISQDGRSGNVQRGQERSDIAHSKLPSVESRNLTAIPNSEGSGLTSSIPGVDNERQYWTYGARDSTGTSGSNRRFADIQATASRAIFSERAIHPAYRAKAVDLAHPAPSYTATSYPDPSFPEPSYLDPRSGFDHSPASSTASEITVVQPRRNFI